MTKRSNKDYCLVGIQFLLFLIYLIPFDLAFGVADYFRFPNLFFAIIGFSIVLVGLFNLDKNLTAFPTPKNNSKLITSGLYKYVRHPIYSGILLTVFGYAFYSQSISRLTISVLLLILFYFKTNYEEQKLSQKYPEYSGYKARTGRFIPDL